MRRALVLLFFFHIATGFASDPLKDEIVRWKTFVTEHQSNTDNWKQLKEIVEPIIVKADKNINEGRRYYALHLLAAVRAYLGAEVYVSAQSSEAISQMSILEAEWKKIGTVLQPAITKKEIPSFEGIPAAFRATGESAFSQIRPFYEASMEYARNTEANEGFFYLGSAQGQLEFARFCSTVKSPTKQKTFKLPALKQEIDIFEDLLLASYIPPASIDQHPVFIRTSAEIKEARELLASGFNYGSLYRLISARVRLSKMLNPGKSISAKETNARAAEVFKRLDQDREDHTIARIFVEMAVGEASDTSADSKGGETARAVFEDALPHYFAAFKTHKKESPLPPAEVTVTLVRWPYT